MLVQNGAQSVVEAIYLSTYDPSHTQQIQMDKSGIEFSKRAAFRGRRGSIDVVRLKEEEKAFNANIGIPARVRRPRRRSLPATLGGDIRAVSIALGDMSDPATTEASRAFSTAPRRGKQTRKRRVGS